MTDFDPEFDKLPDQPVTIGGDKSAATWHGADADYAATLARIDRLTRERDEARAERDALAHVIEQVREYVRGVDEEPGLGVAQILDIAPTVSLSLHDAEVWEQGADAAAENIENGGGELVNPYRAAAIRAEAGQ